MLNLFELAAKITLDKKDFDNGLKQSESRMSKFASGVGKTFKAVGVAAGAMVAAGGAAFVKLTKQAFDAAADYEQLVGGMQKLYGGAATKLQKYAGEAFKTAGMDANTYMQNVTGFSAALINSLAGNTDKAADLADMAMRDIADNANTFGKYTAEELAGVYQALAKGQYQTLDNLNLGFGGTKKGMEDLIKEANRLRKANGEAANLTIDSYADIVQAIHEVQTSMNITGTTSKEAASTISGAWGMVKASFGNFLAGGGQYAFADVADSLNNALDISVDRLSRIVPRLIKQGGVIVKRVGAKVPELMQKLGPALSEASGALIGMVGDTLPSLISSAAGLLPGFVTGLGNLFKAAAPKIPQMLKSIWSSIKGAANSFGGLVFGTNEKGEVKWPTWDDVKAGAKTAWNFIKDKAKALGTEFGKLIFGTNEKGEVKWPTWDEVQQAAIDTWNGIKDKAKTLVTGAGKIIFGENENGEVKWPENVTELAGTAKTWWNDKVKPKLKGAFDFVMDMFGLPDSSELSAKIEGWWASARASIGNLFESIFTIPGPNEVIDKLRESVNGAIEWVNKTLGTNIGKIGEDAVDLSEDALAEVTRKQTMAEHFIDRIESLSETYGENASFTAVYQQTVQQLLSLFPELGKNFDKESGKLLTNTQRLRDDLAARVDLAKQIALESAMAEQDKKLADAMKAKLDAQAEYNALLDEGAKKQEDMVAAYDRLMNSGWMKAGNNAAVAEEVGAVLTDDDLQNTEKVADAVSKLLNVYEQAFSGDYSIAKAIGMNFDDFNALKESLNTYSDLDKKIEEAKGKIEEADAAMEAAKQKYESYAKTIQSVMEEAQSAVAETTAEIKAIPNEVNVNVNVHKNYDEEEMSFIDAFGADGSNAKGLGYVPKNGYRAILHRGEMVLNRSRADDYRNGEGGGSASGLYGAIVAAVKAGMAGVSVRSYLNGRDITDDVGRDQAQDVNARRFQPA